MTTPFKSACWLGSAVDSNRNYLVDVDVQTVFLRQPDQILHAPPNCSIAVAIALWMDWFTEYVVPFARRPSVCF